MSKPFAQARTIAIGGKFTKDESTGEIFTRVAVQFPLPSYSEWSNSSGRHVPSSDHVFAIDQQNNIVTIHPDNHVYPLPEIAERQAAAATWAGEFFPHTFRAPAKRALAVIVGTDYIRNYLAERDPMALKQAQEALTPGTSYINHLKK